MPTGSIPTIQPSDKNVLYASGCTPEGALLIGGVWKLWEQEGFPIELSYLNAAQKGDYIDWMEAMADASCTNNLPALVGHMEAFLTKEDMDQIKMRYMALLNSGLDCHQIMAKKKSI